MRIMPFVLAVGAACNRLDAAPDDAERQAVTATVQLYFQGHATGDGAYFRKAFHPEAKLFSVRDGAFEQKPLDQFAGGATGKPADDEAKRVRRIVQIDIAGTAAVAKVELIYPKVSFIDYLSLLKLDGRWVIVNKIFHVDQRPAAVPSKT